jgi:hypothetical protein
MNTQGAPSGDESTSGPRPADVAPEADAGTPDTSTPDAGTPTAGGPVADGSASGAAQRDPTAVAGPDDEFPLLPLSDPGPDPGHRHTRPYAAHATEPIFVAPPAPRRRRSDWPILLFALVVSVLIMAACCIAGFAFYVRNGGHFH